MSLPWLPWKLPRRSISSRTSCSYLASSAFINQKWFWRLVKYLLPSGVISKACGNSLNTCVARMPVSGTMTISKKRLSSIVVNSRNEILLGSPGLRTSRGAYIPRPTYLETSEEVLATTKIMRLTKSHVDTGLACSRQHDRNDPKSAVSQSFGEVVA
jgi:hypothetical protein